MIQNETDFENDLRHFGPTTPSNFDFTALFENAFLSIVPSVLLALIIPFRLQVLSKSSRKVSRSILHGSKLILLAIFTALQAGILILYATDARVRTATSLASAALLCADALALCFLSHAEHIRSSRPSTIINAYLFITIIFDVARVRTLWIARAPIPIAVVFTITTGVKLGVAISEAIEKRRILLLPFRDSAPESTSGLYSRSVFWWLNTLMRTGYKRVIHNEDLFPIEDSMRSSTLSANAQSTWESADKSTSHVLFWAILRANWRPLLDCIFPRLCLIGFSYTQPLLLSRAVDFVDSQDSDNVGWGLTGAFGVVFFGAAVAKGSYFHMAARFVTAVRGSLVGIIYMKTVDLSVTALDESAAITLMSNDTETICMALQNLHELWAVPIELGIAVWLLQRQLGISFLAPAVVAIISTLSVIAISNYVGAAQKKWNQGIQTRVDVTASMLGSMRAVKLLGFTDKLTEIIQGLRVTELMIAGIFRRLLVARVFFANSMTFVAPLASLIFFVILADSNGQKLDTAKAYTTLSLLSLITGPINTLLRTIPALNGALACFERVQAFLESEARRPHVLPLTSTLEPVKAANDTTLEVQIPASRELTTFAPSSQVDNAGPNLMEVRNASFAWSHAAVPTISDITFDLPRSSFLFIIGPVGSGKSTLLKGLMSETPSMKGVVYSSISEIAFVDQTPWIQNKSIRDNVLGQSLLEPAWYEEVMKACALDYDVEEMPDGDETLVGSLGISLSGGQKQRLALTRAIYARKELLLIDDGFSGLDAKTEEKVFARLFGKQGLLRRLGTTVILVTHAVHRLPAANQIIALGLSGRIVEQGTVEELKSAGGYVESLASKHRQNHSTEVGAVEIISRTKMAKLKVSEADSSIPLGEISTYKYYLASIGWTQCLINLSILVISGIALKLTEVIIKSWTSAVSVHGNSANAFYLGIYGLVSGIAIVAYPAGVNQYFLYVVPTSSEELHARLLKTVMSAPLSFFTSTDTGTTTNRFSQDMSVIDGELPFAVSDLIYSIVAAILGAILMCISAGYFTLTIPFVIFTVYIIQRFYLRTSRQIRILDLESKSPLFTHFIETLSGLPTIRAFNWSSTFIAKNLALLDASQKPYYLLFCIQRWLALVLDTMVSVLAIILMVLVVKLRHTIGAGYVGLALLNVMGFSHNLAWVVRQWTATETSIGAIARLKMFAETTPSENLACEIESVPDTWPAHGAIRLSNLSAAYTLGGPPILKDVSLDIRAGEKVGICGRSGSGKSSLVMALFRMLEYGPGSSIIVDGIDISTIPRQVVRERFNAVPQDPFFLKGSIRFNISTINLLPLNDASIITALRKVQLWAVVQAKGGLDAPLETETFSHGQRQLFCLARALLKESRVVVMDEISSSIDVATDALIQKVVREEFRGVTMLVVAHRLETILDFDRIAVVSNGRLVEFDEPNALLDRQSVFRELLGLEPP